MSRIDNNYFTYRETPTTENGTGTLVDIKGQTLKWNQLVSSASGWVSNNGTLSQSGNTYTYTVTALGDYDYQNRMQRAFPFVIPKGHKMFLSCEFYYPRNTPIFIYMIRASSGVNRSIGGTTVANQWTRISGILYETSTEFGHYQLALATIASNGYSVGDSVQVRNPMAIDLTMLFGEGNEPTTVDEFKSLFPLDYYDFNIGSLIPFNGNGIKATGKNLLNPSYRTKTSNNIRYNQTTPFRLLKGKTYTLSTSDGRTCNGLYISFFGTTNYIAGYDVSSITYTPTEDVDVDFNAYWTHAQDIDNVYLQLEFSSSATTYEPYSESVIKLPISTYFPSGMKDVPDYANGGKIYDEMTSSKAKTRVGIVDLGSLEWTSANTSTQGISRMRTASLGNVISKPSNVSVRANVICANYETLTANSTYIKNTGISIDNGGDILVYDPNYNTSESVASFKQAMSGKYLYFELATPIETAISPELDLTFNIDKGGTEELLPSGLLNGSVDLGSLTWTLYGANNHEFTAELPNMKVGTMNASIPSLGVNAVANYAQWTAQRPNDSLYKDSNGKLHLRLNPYTTVAELTSALQGVYLWYETTDSTPTTTPILCDILYRGLIPVSVTVYPLGAGTVEGAGQYRYGETVTLVAESSDGIYRFLRYEDENGDTLSTDATYSFIAGE